MHPALPQPLPLFPLQAVLLPGGPLALQIFEVRYLEMIRNCHRDNTPFGVVCLSAGTEVRRAGAPAESFHDVGTLATISQLETLQPALLRVQCTGTQRFRADNPRQQPNGLWVADATLLPDDPPTPIPADLQDCATQLAALLRRHGIGEDLQLDDCGWVANRWCEVLPLPHTVKQRLMALDNPLLRLELVNDILDQNA